jgi:hypothetical protein
LGEDLLDPFSTGKRVAFVRAFLLLAVEFVGPVLGLA